MACDWPTSWTATSRLAAEWATGGHRHTKPLRNIRAASWESCRDGRSICSPSRLHTHTTWHRISRCLSAVLGTAQGMVVPVAPAQAMPVQPVATAMVTMQVIVPPSLRRDSSSSSTSTGSDGGGCPLGAAGCPMTIQVLAAAVAWCNQWCKRRLCPCSSPPGESCRASSLSVTLALLVLRRRARLSAGSARVLLMRCDNAWLIR